MGSTPSISPSAASARRSLRRYRTRLGSRSHATFSGTDITEGHYAKRPDLIVEVAADALDEAFAGIDA
ncbi:MAG: hypothetical protein BGN97_00030 [Microbacterium sp. 69-10]|nr:MAG: hypothetical protein BGN97_00030 [Microbacterium sp. 69-10]